MQNGGSRGAGRFLVPGTGDEGPPQEVARRASWAMQFLGGRVLRVQGRGRFAGRRNPCSNAASHIFKNQGLPCPSRLSHSIVVKGYIFFNGRKQAFAEMLLSRADAGLSAKYAVSLHIKVSLHIITGFLAWTADSSFQLPCFRVECWCGASQVLVVKAFVEAPSSWCFFRLTFVFADAALKELIRCVVPGNLRFRRVGGR